MNTHNYAQALFLALEGVSGDVREKRLGNFLSILKENSHMNLLPKIVKHLEHLDRTEKQQKVIAVTSAGELDNKEALRIVREIKEFDEIKDPLIQRIVNKKLIGGVVVQSHNKRVDMSHKAKLLQLYNTLTNN